MSRYTSRTPIVGLSHMRLVFQLLALGCSCVGSASATTLAFSAQHPEHEVASDEYAAIWANDGRRIVSLLEQVTRTTLPEERIDVVVFEGVSNSGRPGGPMYLRASYPRAEKQATVVHELAHRYVDAVGVHHRCYDDIHQVLALVLAEVWGTLWGEAFVREQSAVEAARQDRYRSAWTGVMDLTADARKERLDAFLGCRKDR